MCNNFGLFYSAQRFAEWVFHAKTEPYRWECLFLPDKGAFFVNYITTAAFIGTSLELIRFPDLFFYVLRLCLARYVLFFDLILI